jgi:aminopeptidase N
MSSEHAYRLPRTVTPSRYDLTLEPDLTAGTFSGREDVAVTLHERSSEIVLNAKELLVTSGSLRNADGRTIAVEKVVVDEEAERIALDLTEAAEPGAWTLALGFEGPLNDRMIGFYRSVFDDGDGEQHVIATTHFEATDARRAFPCWDEPDLKAVFGVTLVVDAGLTALSNGPESDREPLPDGRMRVRFADTMPMSTYLVCFVVGSLVVGPPSDAHGVPVRIACRPGKEHLAAFAQQAAVYALDWFADYYGIPYPDAKLDNIAIPDFAQGAMENLGCVTYRETLLLLDPEHATQVEKLDVAETVAHELAHMWFGDLVTMRWWNGIWLNEAFATFMAYLCVDAMHPEWRVFDAFARIRSNAFEVDALATSRPIEYPVHSPDDASGMFDILTYTKGGAVLRMLEQWLGPERFRDGIRRYLRTHAYGNTETHDLWDALEEETGEPVRRVMDAWIFRPGYPFISVTRDGETLRFTQRRFLPSDPADVTTWPVPLVVRQVTADGERIDRALVEADGRELPLAAPDALVVANAGGASFVRVSYDDDLRKRLLERAASDLTAVERQCLVDDAWAAVVTGTAPVGSFVELASGLRDEDDLSVWQTILTGLSWSDRFVEGEARARFRDFVRGLIGPALDRLGWEVRVEDTELDRELRGELVRALGILADDPEAQAQAREVEAEGRAGGNVDPAVAAAAIDVVAFAGNTGDYEAYRHHADRASTPQEEIRYRIALARFRDPALMERTLASTLTDEVRRQDAPFLLARATVNRDLGPAAWAFIERHWAQLLDRFAPSNIIGMISGIRFLTQPETVASVQAFFEHHDIPQNHLQLQQALERQRVLAALRQRVSAELAGRFGA